MYLFLNLAKQSCQVKVKIVRELVRWFGLDYNTTWNTSLQHWLRGGEQRCDCARGTGSPPRFLFVTPKRRSAGDILLDGPSHILTSHLPAGPLAPEGGCNHFLPNQQPPPSAFSSLFPPSGYRASALEADCFSDGHSRRHGSHGDGAHAQKKPKLGS